jgi:hypothetical protein
MLQSMNRGPQTGTQDEDLEPREGAISRLMEMGVTRNISWDALDFMKCYGIELAAEYLLAHPVSSLASIEHRRTERAKGG